MVMDTMQIRLSKGLVRKIDEIVESGIYANRSDVVRDAVRRLVVGQAIGISSGTSKDMPQIRKRLSNEIRSYSDIEKINRLQ